MHNIIEHAGVTNFMDSQGNRIIFKSGNGSFVYDVNDNYYFDFILGFGPVIIGHNNEEFNKLLVNYLKNGLHLPSYTKFHYLYIENLFNSLIEKYSFSFFKTASESITAAIRLSSNITNKYKIVRCGYIGWHDAQIANSVSWHEDILSNQRNELRFRDGFRGVSNFEKVFNWNDFNLSNLEILLSNNKISCFILDVYQISFCDILIIKEALKIVRKHNVIIIIDETKTGGRCSELGFSIDNNIDFDFMVFGKSLANGAPISILFGNKDIMKYAIEARVCGTFSKELFSIYSALATFEIMRGLDGFNTLKNIGNKLCFLFNSIINDLGLSNYLSFKPLFQGTIINISFYEPIINDYGLRYKLAQSFINNNLLLLQGHPSFVCLSHVTIFESSLITKFYDSLLEWRNNL